VSYPVLAGGAGAQIIYPAAGGGQSAAHAGVVSPHYPWLDPVRAVLGACSSCRVRPQAEARGIKTDLPLVAGLDQVLALAVPGGEYLAALAA
jgi:hypothetical protein